MSQSTERNVRVTVIDTLAVNPSRAWNRSSSTDKDRARSLKGVAAINHTGSASKQATLSACGLNRAEIKLPDLFADFVAHRGMVVSTNASPIGVLLPPQLKNAVARRQAEFMSGRLCAQEALQILGAAPTDIPIGKHGYPAWPTGFVGSITHSSQLVFAAVSRHSEAISLGIDVEEIIPLDTALQVVPLVATSNEYRRLLKRAIDAELLTTIIFSAKETIFKCLYPLVGRRFDFTDVEIVSIDTDMGTFSFSLSPWLAKLLPATMRLVGRMAVLDGLVHTGFLLPQPL